MPTEKMNDMRKRETHTPEEIINALKVIKEVCSQHKCLEGTCPLMLYNGECGVTDPSTEPEDWVIRPVLDTWKAF